MSNEAGMTLAGVAVKIFGIILLVLGLLLVYFTLKTEVAIVDPRVFMPIGLAIALVGGFMLIAKEV